MNRKIKIVLCLLAVVTGAVGLWQLAPRLLEQRGLYFGEQVYQAETEERTSLLPIQYAGSQVCSQCHQAQHRGWQESEHLTVACEACHGPGQAHVEEGAKPSLDASREACGTCHNELAARPGAFPQIDLAQHNSQLACIACHNPMGTARQVSLVVPTSTATPSDTTPTPWPSGVIEPSGPPRIPHSLEGRSACMACHGSTGFKPFPADHAGRAGDLCQSCHRREGT
ncbi:MAG: hypothetical protein HW388_1266 [Dehalococcoidia bacterium]|nr:hypothetical protein [Dehalococcoidia bacterium]